MKIQEAYNPVIQAEVMTQKMHDNYVDDIVKRIGNLDQSIVYAVVKEPEQSVHGLPTFSSTIVYSYVNSSIGPRRLFCTCDIIGYQKMAEVEHESFEKLAIEALFGTIAQYDDFSRSYHCFLFKEDHAA